MTEEAQKQPVQLGYKLPLLIICLIFLATVFFTYIFPTLRENFLQKDLSPETNASVSRNFDKLVENLENCSTIDDLECICPGFPEYPTVFPADFRFLFYNEGWRTILYRGTKPFKDASLEEVYSLNYRQAYIEDQKLSFKGLFDNKDYVEFRFNSEMPRAVSRLASGEMNRNVISDKFFKESEDELSTFILFNLGAHANNAPSESEVSKEIDKLPECMEGREIMVDSFEKLFFRIDQVIANPSLVQFEGGSTSETISLMDNYKIKFENNKFWLEYKDKKVKKLIKSKISGSLFLAESALVEKEVTYLCEGSKQSGELKDKEKIQIKKINSEVCLFISPLI